MTMISLTEKHTERHNQQDCIFVDKRRSKIAGKLDDLS